MEDFQVGDTVRRILFDNGYPGAKVGQVAVVVEIDGSLLGVVYEGFYPSKNHPSMELWTRGFTELVARGEGSMKPHKHKDMIIAWANGEQIQGRSSRGWIDVPDPLWSEDAVYRIKPTTVGYRRYLFKWEYSSKAQVGVVNSYQDIKNVEGISSFIRWIDDEWQEVEV